METTRVLSQNDQLGEGAPAAWFGRPSGAQRELANFVISDLRNCHFGEWNGNRAGDYRAEGC